MSGSREGDARSALGLAVDGVPGRRMNAGPKIWLILPRVSGVLLSCCEPIVVRCLFSYEMLSICSLDACDGRTSLFRK